MISRFRDLFYTIGAVVLLLCLTGVSVRAQQAGDSSRDRTVVKPQTEGNLGATASSAVSPENVKEAAPNASRASTPAPVSFFVPILNADAKRNTPDAPASDAASSAPQASADKWEFMIAPYLWLAGLSGTVGAGDITTDIDPGVSDVLNALNFGFMGTFEARKNKFMLVTDLMYISLEETKDTSGPLFSSLKANEKVFMLSPVAGYRLAEKTGASLDAIVGIRFWHTSTRLELAPGQLAGRVGESSKNWADVIGGLRGQAHVSKIFSVIGRGDFGGGGSDYSYQLFGGVGIDVSKKTSLFAGYRYLYIKYTRGNSLFDGALHGVVLGAAFRL